MVQYKNYDLLVLTSAILISIIGYFAINPISKSEIANKIFKLKGNDTHKIIFQKICGSLIFTLLAILIVLFSNDNNLANFVTVLPDFQTFVWTVIYILIIFPFVYFNSKTADNLNIYPLIRIKEWSYALLTQSAVSWTVYITSYEILFRGVLFFLSVPIIGIWPSIILNSAIHSIIHIPKGIKEMIGAFPFGVVICFLMYKSGNIWFAVFTHVFLALSNEWLSLYAQPQMKLKRS